MLPHGRAWLLATTQGESSLAAQTERRLQQWSLLYHFGKDSTIRALRISVPPLAPAFQPLQGSIEASWRQMTQSYQQPHPTKSSRYADGFAYCEMSHYRDVSPDS